MRKQNKNQKIGNKKDLLTAGRDPARRSGPMALIRPQIHGFCYGSMAVPGP